MAFQQRRIAAGIACALGLTAGAAAFPAAAQDVRVEVTGSNIRRVDTESPAPVQVITREEIERSGAQTVNEVIRLIPANQAVAYDDTFISGFSVGSAGVSLRGLGQRSTLVLINGRRMVNYGFAQNLQDTFVDLNSIPLAAIERIDVLLDGASAIYGSDAIAGVINIILRKDYTGAEISGTLGYASTIEAPEYRANATLGFGDLAKDKYNGFVTFDYYKRDEATWADHPMFADADFRRFGGGTLERSSTAGTHVRLSGPPLPGNTQAFATCADEVRQGANGATTCVYNPNGDRRTLIPETERAGVFGRLTYAINPDLEAFGEFGYNHNETSRKFQAPFIQETSVVFGPAIGAASARPILPVGNPNNPFTAPVTFRYAFREFGPRTAEVESDTIRALAGLRGTIASRWDWEVGALWARNEADQVNYGNVSWSALQASIADGSYNFLNPGATPQSVLNAVNATTTRVSTSELYAFDAKISGEVFKFDGNSVTAAAGMEFRNESIDDVPSANLLAGDIVGAGSTGTKGDRDVWAGWVEALIPFGKTVELQLAGRYENYSDYGSSAVPKAAVRWQPLPNLLLRASAGKGFRAPTLPEISDSNSYFFVTVVDSTRCAINEDYCAPQSTSGSFASNRDLEAEESTNWVVGGVWEPLRNVSIGLNYYDIKQKKLIQAPDFQDVLDNEALRPGDVIRAAPTAQEIADGVPGSILVIASRYENLGTVRTKGMDGDISIRQDIEGLGRGTLAFAGAYIFSFEQPPAPGAPAEQLAGNYNYPRFKGTLALGLERGPWAGGINFNYIHRYNKSSSAAPAQQDMESWGTTDLQLAYSGWKNAKVVVGVRNVTDEWPVFDSSSSARYDFSQHNPRGRFWYLTGTYTFK